MKHRLSIGIAAALFLAPNLKVFAQSNLQSLPARQDSYIDEGSISRSANPSQPGSLRDRLPKTIVGPAVGMPGDAVSQGKLASSPQQSRRVSSATGAGAAAGSVSSRLPLVRTSAYVDGFGDHVRSDLGYHINGTPYRRQSLQPVAKTTSPLQEQPGVLKYGDQLTPPYKRSR